MTFLPCLLFLTIPRRFNDVGGHVQAMQVPQNERHWTDLIANVWISKERWDDQITVQ